MKLSDKLASLTQSYDVVGTVDLNKWFDIALLERKDWLVNHLLRLRQDTFKNNQRLIFTLTCKANCGNTATNNVLVFLQRLVNQIDISSYFVIVVTSNPVDIVYLQSQNNEKVPITIESIDNEL
jgi:hypothetical protein